MPSMYVKKKKLIFLLKNLFPTLWIEPLVNQNH